MSIYQVVDRMKAQVSLEFLIISTIILFILSIFLGVTATNQIRSQETQVQRRVQDICQNVAEKISKTVYYGKGFYQQAVLPPDIYGNDYNIRVENNQTLVCSTEKFSIIKIFVENKIENETSGIPFFIGTGEISISNEGGVVLIK